MEIRLNQHGVPLCHWSAEEQQEFSPAARRLFEQLYKGSSLALSQTDLDLPMMLNVLANVVTNLFGPMRAALPPGQQCVVVPLFLLTFAAYLKEVGFVTEFAAAPDGLSLHWDFPAITTVAGGETPGAIP